MCGLVLLARLTCPHLDGRSPTAVGRVSSPRGVAQSFMPSRKNPTGIFLLTANTILSDSFCLKNGSARLWSKRRLCSANNMNGFKWRYFYLHDHDVTVLKYSLVFLLMMTLARIRRQCQLHMCVHTIKQQLQFRDVSPRTMYRHHGSSSLSHAHILIGRAILPRRVHFGRDRGALLSQ